MDGDAAARVSPRSGPPRRGQHYFSDVFSTTLSAHADGERRGPGRVGGAASERSARLVKKQVNSFVKKEYGPRTATLVQGQARPAVARIKRSNGHD